MVGLSEVEPGTSPLSEVRSKLQAYFLIYYPIFLKICKDMKLIIYKNNKIIMAIGKSMFKISIYKM